MPVGSWLTYGANERNYTGEAKGLRLTTPYATVSCGWVLMGSESTSEAAVPLPAKGEGLASECLYKEPEGAGTSCTVTVGSTNDLVKHIYQSYYFLEKGSGAELLSISFSCSPEGYPVSCTFSAEKGVPLLMTEEEELAAVTNEAMRRTAGSFLCGNSASLSLNLHHATQAYAANN